jgi:hypothetical protein
VVSAHERGISSFAVEQIFREVWLDAVVRRPPGSEWDRTDHHRFDHLDMTSIRNLLNQVHDSLNNVRRSVSIGAVIEKRIEKIKAARATADTWFGRPLEETLKLLDGVRLEATADRRPSCGSKRWHGSTLC